VSILRFKLETGVGYLKTSTGYLLLEASGVPSGLPSILATLGYTTQTLGTGLTLGTNWFPYNLLGKTPLVGQAVQLANGAISMPGADGSNFGANICTAQKVGTSWAGVAYGGGFYAEATMAFTLAPSPPAPAFPYPTFWAHEIDYAAQIGGGSIQWVGQAAGYQHYIELDQLETVPASSPYISRAGCISWQGNPAVSTNHYPQPNSLTLAPVDMTQPHRYGILVVPATSTTQGYFQNFLDGVAVSYLVGSPSPVQWSLYNPAAPPTGTVQDLAVFDQSHLPLILGTALNMPATVYAASVWQKSSAGNRTGPIPTTTSITPNPVLQGGATFNLTVNGTNFNRLATVYWGSTALTTTYINASQLVASVPSTLIASAGSIAVTVRNQNSAFAVSNATTMTIQASFTVAINSSGLMVSGPTLAPVELRGSNMTGLEGQLIGGSWPNNAWGSLSGFGGPPWATYKTWNYNTVRIPLNVACFLNINMGVLTGGSAAAARWTANNVPGDPTLIYRGQVITAINNARAIGCAPIIEAHWSAPAFILGGVTKYMGAFDQPMFMDYDTTFFFWTADTATGFKDATGANTTGVVAWLQDTFGPGGPQYNAAYGGASGINDIIFELFNEPYFDQANCNYNTAYNGTGSSQTALQVMKSGGWCSSYRNQFNNGTGTGGIGCPNAYCGAVGAGQTNISNVDTYGFNYWWRVAGYQQVLAGIRALGATNVIMVNGRTFSSKQSDIPSIYTTDTLSPPQVGTCMHCYQKSGTSYPGTGDTGDGTATWDTYVNQNIAGTSGIGHAIPVLITEYGNTVNTGCGISAAQPDPYIQYMEGWLDGKTKGAAGGTSWAWNNFQAGSPSPAPFGYSGTTSWTLNILSAPVTFTASTSGNQMTVSAGSGLLVGMVVSGGLVDRAVITSFGTGTGGLGVYTISYAVNQTSTTFTGHTWMPLNGHGQTEYNWSASGFYPAGHWVAATKTLQMIYPLTDAVTSANARHHWAYYDGTNAVQYQIPIVALGGSYPYVFTIDSASAALGMTIGQGWGSTNYGVLTWAPTGAVTSHVVTVTITDQQRNAVQAVFTLSTSSATAHFVFLDALSGSDSGAGTYGAPWQTLQKACGSTYVATGSGAGAICYLKPTATYATSGVKYTDSTDINPGPWFEMNVTRKPVALIGLGGQAKLDWTSGVVGLAIGTAANDFFVAYLNPDGYSSTSNQKWMAIYSAAGPLRLVDWNCTWSNSGYGTSGTDNATGHFATDIGGSSLRSYIALLNFTETNRQSGSTGNNYPGHSLYSCDHWVSDGFTINMPTATFDSICYAKGTNTNFEMRNHFINVGTSGSGGVCSTPGFFATGEPTSTSGEVRYCYIGQNATGTNQKIGTQSGTYGTFYLNRNTLIGQFQNGFGGTGVYQNNVVQTTGTPIPTGGGSTSSGNVTGTSGIINSTTLQLQGSALSSVGTAGAQIG
jgi:hypothetical protein